MGAWAVTEPWFILLSAIMATELTGEWVYTLGELEYVVGNGTEESK